MAEHTIVANKLMKMRASGMRVAFKLGSACVVNPKTLTLRSELSSNVSDIDTHFLSKGHEAIVISSGAVSLGKREFNFSASRKLSIPEKQSCASVGQIMLSNLWADNLGMYNRKAGQILLKGNDLDVENGNGSYRNFINTNSMLLTNGAIPIVNENDTTATEELKFGDNDKLSALVAKATDCDLLIILSKENGFYDRDPLDSRAKHYSVITNLTDEHFGCAGDSQDDISTGGMITKLQAVEIAMSANIPVILTSGLANNAIEKVLSGAQACTCFVPPILALKLRLGQ